MARDWKLEYADLAAYCNRVEAERDRLREALKLEEDTLDRYEKALRFLLGVISYLDDMDCWYLDEAPGFLDRLREDFGWTGGRDKE